MAVVLLKQCVVRTRLKSDADRHGMALLECTVALDEVYKDADQVALTSLMSNAPQPVGPIAASPQVTQAAAVSMFDDDLDMGAAAAKVDGSRYVACCAHKYIQNSRIQNDPELVFMCMYRKLFRPACRYNTVIDHCRCSHLRGGAFVPCGQFHGCSSPICNTCSLK